MAHILTFTSPPPTAPDDPPARVEVHVLNAGEFFEGFGGSRHGLVVRETASLITRWISPFDFKDTEWDIHDPRPWKWFDELVNLHRYKMTATQPCEPQSVDDDNQQGESTCSN